MVRFFSGTNTGALSDVEVPLLYSLEAKFKKIKTGFTTRFRAKDKKSLKKY
jgi:hypothetical protein